MGATPRRTGRPKVGQGRARTMGAKAFLIHPPYQGVCGRHGTEDHDVTPGGLVRLPGGTGRSDPISVSEVGSGAGRVVGRPNSTRKRSESCVTATAATRVGRGRRPTKAVGRE